VESTPLARATEQIANQSVNHLEAPPGSNSDNGGAIDLALAYCSLDPGHAYCASCCSYWIHLAGISLGIVPTFKRSGSAVHLFQINTDLQISKDSLTPSDLPCLGINIHADKIHGHAFLIVGLDVATGVLTTIDPNSDLKGSSEGLGIFLLQRRNVKDADRLGYLRIA
jgi:hypothetical protein